MNKVTVETRFVIWGDSNTGESVEVREDPDGLGLCEIVNEETKSHFCISIEMAEALSGVLQKFVAAIRERGDNAASQ